MYKKYKVKIRRDFADVKPEAEQLDGKVFRFIVGWVMDEKDTDIYVGETTMIPHRDDGWPLDGPTWIASGDLTAMENSDG